MTPATRWSALTAQAQAGDARAYYTLLRECLPLLRNICRQCLREPAEVEDAVQDTLLTLHRVRATQEPARPFRLWIAGRPVLDRGRSIARGLTRNTGLKAVDHVGVEGGAKDRLTKAGRPPFALSERGTARSNSGQNDAKSTSAAIRSK